MTGTPTVLLLATAGITLLLAPALALYFGGRPAPGTRRIFAIAIPGAMLIATIEWMLLGASLDLAAFQGALVAAAVATVLAVGLRTGSVRGYAVFCALWITLVLVPVGYALFDVVRGPLARAFGTLDFGGVSILALCTGTAALALALVGRGRGNLAGGPPQRSARGYTIVVIAGLFGWLAVDIGAELVLGPRTVTLALNELWAAAAGALGWAGAQVVDVRRPTLAGAVGGLLAGSIVVLPASPWLETWAVVSLGLIAGILGHVAVTAGRRNGMGQWASLIGVCLVPGAVGLGGTGIVAAGLGVLYSGKLALLTAQVSGLLIVVGYSLVVTTLIAIGVDTTMRLVSSSRLVDESVVRFYRELGDRDLDAALGRMHPDAVWDGATGTAAIRERLELVAGAEPVRSTRRRGGWIEVQVAQGDTTAVHAIHELGGLIHRVERR